MTADNVLAAIPLPLTAYPDAAGEPLLRVLLARVGAEPFNAVATAIFLLAVVHTFVAPRFVALAHRMENRQKDRRAGPGAAPPPSLAAELLHLVGEIEVVFGLWALVLLAAMTIYAGWDTARHYFSDGVPYTESLFVVVIMALAATRPIVVFAESALRRVAGALGGTPAAWWFTILTVGPLLGSFITEPAAMTICALLLSRQFFNRQPGTRLKYATLGALFVNISIGGTLTHFAATPVLVVARPWNWDAWFMFTHIGWKAVIAIAVSTLTYQVLFRDQLRALGARTPDPVIELPEEGNGDGPLGPTPIWVTGAHLFFVAWTVFNAHYPVLFVGGFLFFLGFARATAPVQSRTELKTPLLVGFFLAGLVLHGGLQGWWIAPVLEKLSKTPLFLGSLVLTAFNDNALITYLATLVTNLDGPLRLAVVEGAVVGGGLTVIANAPNPAGQALLNRFFDGAISPGGLLLGALIPTLLAAGIFMLL